MENTLWTGMVDNTNKIFTENGATTLRSTKSDVLDLFSMGGALRKASSKRIQTMVSKALAEDFDLGLRCLFYLRNVRGSGQGERRVFREGLRVLSEYYPQQSKRILPLIAHYGRWDDILYLKNIPIRDHLKEQLLLDTHAEFPSLCAKWMPSVNASSQETKKIANKLSTYLGMTNAEYRKTLSLIRKKIDLIETKITNKEYCNIDYSKIPSKAHTNYRKTFYKYDQVRYEAYLESVKKGEKKINAGTLFPYELVSKAYRSGDSTLDAQWAALPNYVREDDNGIVVADVSGSMMGQPMDVSVSLAMYMAERNKGKFAGKYISFASRPALHEVRGDTLAQKVRNLRNTDVGYDTNVEAVFDLILNTGVQNKIPQSEMPETIYMVSDMEFNNYSIQGSTNFEGIKQKYADSGYEMPVLVFWNVRSGQANVPVDKNEDGVILVSGCSPSIFKMAMDKTTPEIFMRKVLNGEEFDKITECLN